MAGVTSPGGDGYASALERLFDGGTAVGLSEAQLLERFAGRRDEAAFAALVDRHGPMVLGVCRRFLRDPHDVDDAFQAVFLVLARKAGGIGRKELLGNWLYGVSRRVASRARALAVRRTATDGGGRLDFDARRPPAPGPAEILAREEEGVRLLEEVGRLPARYRVPVVACYLEGKSCEEAAALLNCPVGTIKGRLARARDLLRVRLERRGVTASTTALATALAAPDLRAAVPPALASEAARLALAATSSPSAWMTAVATSTRSLAEGAIRTMNYAHLKLIAIPATAASLLGIFAAAATIGSPQDTGSPPAATKSEDATNNPETKVVKAQATTIKKSGRLSSAKAKDSVASASSGTTSEPGMMPGMMSGSAGGMGGMGGMTGMGGGMGGMGRNSPVPIPIAMARVAAFLAAEDASEENRALYQALDQKITLKLDGNPTFEGLLSQVRAVEAAGKPLPVYVSRAGLLEAEVTPSTPIELNLVDVPLKAALRLALKDIGLAYCVRDGVLIISTIDDIHSELLEAQSELIARNPGSYESGPAGYMNKTDTGGFR